MKFLLAKKPEIIEEFLTKNKLIAVECSFYGHPIKVKSMVEKFIAEQKEQDNGGYITYNLFALNFIPEDMVIWLEPMPTGEISITPFWDVFSSWKGIKTGDVFDFVARSIYDEHIPEMKPNANLLQDGEVRYFIPTRTGG